MLGEDTTKKNVLNKIAVNWKLWHMRINQFKKLDICFAGRFDISPVAVVVSEKPTFAQQPMYSQQYENLNLKKEKLETNS